jgi:plasmid stability protein
VDIPDEMYRQLRLRAAREGRTAKSLILQGVESILTASESLERRPVTLPLVRSRQPGTLRLDNARIYDVISFP